MSSSSKSSKRSSRSARRRRAAKQQQQQQQHDAATPPVAPGGEVTPHQGAHSAPVGHNSNNNNSIPPVPHSTQPRRSYSGKRHSSARRSLQFREARLLHGALHVHVVTDAAAVQSSTLFSPTASCGQRHPVWDPRRGKPLRERRRLLQ